MSYRAFIENRAMRSLLVSIAACLALGVALAWPKAPGDAGAQEPTPTPTPSLSFQSNATPPSGTYVNAIASPPPTFSYSLVISNVGETAATPLIVQFDLTDVVGPPTLFSSTQGTCAWSDQPDYYHGFSTGECDLGTLPPPEGSPSSATVTLNGTIFWNFYSHDYARASIRLNGTPIAQGFTYPFGTPTPTSTPMAVGGVVAFTEGGESGSSGGSSPLVVPGAIVAAVVAAAAGWFARKRWLTSR
jgi:hypothetical protein